MTAETLGFILTGGLVLGALYALMATGLAVVWTTLGIFNFAHGAFIAVGAYAAWQVG
ncbi:MAG: branched-chain amino acid ABC transporter permease, partial [Pseudomonadota bacterium]